MEDVDLCDEATHVNFGTVVLFEDMDDKPYQGTRIGFVIDPDNRIILLQASE